MDRYELVIGGGKRPGAQGKVFTAQETALGEPMAGHCCIEGAEPRRGQRSGASRSPKEP